ncbi:MAG: TRC40/GET3/ArsA family transport-energizing ATPase, partial [Candidatus Thermoplasmatota archaeon]|nr:TRC40/GET3/ArsA family transport-energizing ATPase [Candidatus Thermoplasmatota archaeon]
DSGLCVLLVSSDPAHSTSDSLGVDLTSEPTPVEGVPGLFGLELNPEAKLSTFMPKLGESLSGMSSSPFAAFGGLGGMFDQSARDEIQSIKEEVDSSELVLPGLDEAIAFDELLKHVENPSWDVIVFDTAPTGHTLRFLSLPELIEAWSGRLLRMMRVSGGIRSMLFGRKQSDAMKEELERFRRRVLHVRRVLSDPSTTSFTLVTIPERMGVNETVRANQSLGEYNLPVTGCLVNRVTPELDHPFLQRRRSEEQGHISELEETLDIPVTTMELFDSEVQGLERLRTYGRLLYGEPSQLDEELGPYPVGDRLNHSIHRGMYVEQGDGVEIIHLHFPGLEREDLSLRSEEGILYVGVNGREHAIPTTSPAKSTQVKAKLENDILRLEVPVDE